MTSRRTYLSGNEGEERFGYSQGLQSGDVLHISGQVGRDNLTGALDGEPTLAGRCTRALQNVRDAATQLGGPGAELISLQLHFTVPLEGHWDDLAGVLTEFSGHERPAISIVPITTLFSPDYLVEVSAMATAKPRQLVADDTPIGRDLSSSRAVRVGDQVFLAGHLPVGAAGELVGDGLIAQFEQVCTRLDDSLQAVGGGLADIVSTHIWIAGAPTPEETAALSPAHRAVFGQSKPTATLIFVPELPLGARVQISAVASVAGDAPAA